MGGHLAPRPVQGSDRRLSEPVHAVRVLPDVSGIDTEFDYSVPDGWRTPAGTIVRVDLNGRRVRGWVLEDGVEPPDGIVLRPLRKVTGAGPGRELISLSRWAAWRWAGKRSTFMHTASPERAVSLSSPSEREPWSGPLPAWFDREATLIRVPPASDPVRVASEAHAAGPALVLAPSHRSAVRIARMLRTQGTGEVVVHPHGWATAASRPTTVVGTRAAAWSPGKFSSFVVIDAHDEAFASEASPTWNAVDVLVERARRERKPVAMVSFVTPLLRSKNFPNIEQPGEQERQGWPALHVVDMRAVDPHKGLYSPALVEELRSEARVVCVLNRKGRAQLLVCGACQHLAVCERCGSSVAESGHELRCRRCHHVSPVVCSACGATRLKKLRPGVSSVREDLERLAGRPVGEVTADTKELPDALVLVGTEAVLHRVGRADRVAFLEIDQELVAQRVGAGEAALVLLGRAARLVGGRHRNGRVLCQTRLPQHDVLQAAMRGDPDTFLGPELQRREEMEWPPFAALARISGEAAAQFVSSLPQDGGNCEVMGPDEGGAFLLRSRDHAQLSDVLTKGQRPSGKRLRVEVDPVRL